VPPVRLLFRLGYVYHRAAFDPVIELFRRDPAADLSFSLELERRRRWFVVDRPFRPPVLDTWEAEGDRFTAEREGFDAVITGDTLPDAASYGRTLLCFLNHGTGIKNVLYRRLAACPRDRYQIFVEGPHRAAALARSGALGRSEVHVIGLPKLDPLFQGRYDRAVLLRRWGLDPARPTVLFAPTYKPTCLYRVRDAVFDQTRDCNLVIKLHPYSWMGKYAPHRHHRIYERRARHHAHAVLLPPDEYNIVPWYAAADTVLSEASSTVFDFLATGKTGIIFDLDGDRLRHSDGEPVLEVDNREFLRDAFVHIRDGGEIGAAVERALQPTAAMREAADRERGRLFVGLDGRASERFKATVEALLAEGGHENDPGAAA
jgi:hypothetical protein